MDKEQDAGAHWVGEEVSRRGWGRCGVWEERDAL